MCRNSHATRGKLVIFEIRHLLAFRYAVKLNKAFTNRSEDTAIKYMILITILFKWCIAGL